MDIRNFNSFVVAAELASVTLAAKRLNMTQSALSKQISGLEDYLGVKLFEKSGRNIRLTTKGEAVLAKVNQVLAAEKNLRTFASDLAEGETGVLKIGACSQLIERFLPRFLKTWSKANPGVEIRVEDGGGAELAEKLKSGAVQLTVSAMPAAPVDYFEMVPLGKLGFLAVATAEYLKSSADAIEITDLIGMPILVLNKRHASREVFDAACRLSGEGPDIIMESYSPHTLFAMAEGGNGVAVVPSSLRPGIGPLIRRPIALRGELIQFDICAMWNSRAPLPLFGQRFVADLTAHFAAEQAAEAAQQAVAARQPHLHVV